MKKIAFAALTFALLFSCSSSEETVKDENDAVQEEKASEQVDVVPDRILTMELKGMVCQMGCGGSIRKELKATGGVESCEFDFDEDREIDIAKIKFDKDKITVDEIVNVVSKINDGQFDVVSTKSEDYYPAKTNDNSTNAEEELKVNMSSSSGSYSLNIFDLISGLLVH